MNFRKRDFLLSNVSIFFFITSILLYINFLLIDTLILKPSGIQFFNDYTFIHISAFLLLLALIAYYILTSGTFKELFKSDENLQKKIKETLHELNTPVATIMANIKMLERSCNNEKHLKKIERIKLSCENLLDLYEDMEYSIKQEIDRIDIGKFKLYDSIENTLKKFDDLKRDIEIINKVSPEPLITTDKIGFNKMLDNLISNSIKYNKPNGKIVITLENKILSIYDTGCGIDTKNLFLVFDEFYQENSNSSGYGLGLKIVKDFCDKNKIDLKISSTPNVETTISLNLKEIF